MLTTFLAAVGLGLAVAAPIGPTGTTAIRHGLSGGGLQTFWIGQGAALTDFLYILATYLGLTPLLTRLTWLPLVLYGAGVVIIGRMAWGALREAVVGSPASELADGAAVGAQASGEGVVAAAGARASGEGLIRAAGALASHKGSATGEDPLPWHRALWLGLAVTVVNPATITSWLTVGGSFISQNLTGRSTAESLLLMSGIWIGTASWFTVLAVIVGVARAAVGRIPWLFRAVGGLSGLVLTGFAVRFAWQFTQELLGFWPG